MRAEPEAKTQSPCLEGEVGQDMEVMVGSGRSWARKEYWALALRRHFLVSLAMEHVL